MPQTLLRSSRYREFIRARNKALERVSQHAQVDLSRILFTVLEQIERLAAHGAIQAAHAYAPYQVSKSFETGTLEIFTQAFPLFVQRLRSQRRSTFVLAYSGEQEAIGRATKRKAQISRGDFQKQLHEEMTRDTLAGPLDKRVWLCLMKLRHRIVQAFELALTQELKPEEIAAKVKDAFPPIQVYKRPPKELKPVRESRKDPTEDQDWFDFEFIDEADWDLAVQAYLDTELPPNRFDNSASWDSESGVMKYNWELEQESTEDFVQSVRSGQVAGAEDLGVKDFVWIAILDDKTCDECCLPRNGKTTSEIEQMDDDCDATVPPAHFNCRCDLGPVASTDEVEGPDWSSFNDWLESA